MTPCSLLISYFDLVLQYNSFIISPVYILILCCKYSLKRALMPYIMDFLISHFMFIVENFWHIFLCKIFHLC